MNSELSRFWPRLTIPAAMGPARGRHGPSCCSSGASQLVSLGLPYPSLPWVFTQQSKSPFVNPRSTPSSVQNPPKTSHLTWNQTPSPPKGLPPRLFLFPFWPQACASPDSLHTSHTGLLPRDFCSCCSLCLEHSSSSFPDGCLPPRLQNLAPVSPSC